MERSIGISTEDVSLQGSAVLYCEMADKQREICTALRTGEIIIAGALRDPKVLQTIRGGSADLLRRISGEDGDVISLEPIALCGRLKEIVGNEGVVRILMNTIRHLDESNLNGQGEPVRSQLCLLKQDYDKALNHKPRAGISVR